MSVVNKDPGPPVDTPAPITRRDSFVIAALTGLLSGDATGMSGLGNDLVAEKSVRLADAVMKEIDK